MSRTGATDVVDLSGNGKGVAFNTDSLGYYHEYTTADRMARIFEPGRVVFDKTNGKLYLGDGIKPGGNLISRMMDMQPLSFSDFQNGVYYLDGVAKTFDEMWGQGQAPQFYPSTLVPGVGIYVSANDYFTNRMGASAEHLTRLGEMTQLTNGLTFVADYSLTGYPSGEGVTKPRLVIEMGNAAYSAEWMFYHNGYTYDSVADYDALFTPLAVPGPLGDQKIAVNLGPEQLSRSRDGGIVQMAQGTWQTLADVGFIDVSVYTAHASVYTATATLRSLTIYHKMDDAFLPGLST